MGDAQWETGICGCCDVKDCGVGCCCKLYCGGPCIFGSALEKAGLGSCFSCCCALGCFPTCVLCNARKQIATKYGIKEDDCTSLMLSCCCPSCTLIQTINQVRMPIHAHTHFGGKGEHTWAACGDGCEHTPRHRTPPPLHRVRPRPRPPPRTGPHSPLPGRAISWMNRNETGRPVA